MEHSAIDGHTMLQYLDFMFKYAQERAHETIPKGYYTPSALQPLNFVLSPNLRKTIFRARVAMDAFAQTLSVAVNEFTAFGEYQLRQHAVPPDAFVQVAFQCAYYRLHGGPASTYESAQTKIFYHGRTECIRSVTMQSDAFARHMRAPERQGDSAVLLRAALAAHRERTRLASQGQGLKRIAKRS